MYDSIDLWFQSYLGVTTAALALILVIRAIISMFIILVIERLLHYRFGIGVSNDVRQSFIVIGIGIALGLMLRLYQLIF